MRLLSVSIEGFRSIRCLDNLEFGSPTILSGHNDAGKSAIIDAILMLLGEYKLTLDDMTYDNVQGDESTRVAETSVTGVFELNEREQEDFGCSQLELRRRSLGGDPAVLLIRQEAPTDARLRDYADLTVPNLKDRLDTLEISHGTLKLKADFIAALDAAADAAPKELVWAKATSAMEKALPAAKRFDAAGPFDAEDAIRATLQTAYRAHLEGDELSGSVREIELRIEQKLISDVASIRDHIKTKVGDVGEIDIQPTVNLSSANGLKSTSIMVTNPVGEPVNLQRSGAGRARRITLAVWEYNSLLLRETGQDIVLLYDEPDTHLDYAHQRELMQLIHEQASERNITVVVASHSMNMIDGVDISNVVHIRHENHRTVVDRLSDDSEIGSHLGAIAASVGLRNTVLLHERLFVGVEGDSEARALPVLFKLATGRHLESCGIALWPCGNNEGALRFAEFLVKHGRQVAFLVDSDSRTGARHIFNDDKLIACGLDPNAHCLYVGEPNEIEDVFSDELWAETANLNWPRDGEGQPSSSWSAHDFAALRGGKFSKLVEQMLREGSTIGPSGKPEVLSTLALGLRTRDQIPAILIDRFEKLVERAG